MASSDAGSFTSWLRDHLRTFQAWILIGVSLISTGSNLALSSGVLTLEQNLVMKALYGIQAGVILILAAVIAFGRKPFHYDRYRRGSEAIAQFWKWWPGLWLSWFLLYLLLMISLDLSSTPLLTVALHATNNVSTLILLMCFHLLADPTFPSHEFPPEGDIFPHKDVETSHGRAASIEDGQPIANPHGQFFFWVAIFALASIVEVGLALSAKDPKDPSLTQMLRVFGIGYGVLAATATALVVGQLDTKLMGVPPVVLVILFVYAGLQPSFDFIADEKGEGVLFAARAFLISAALMCKIVLFATVQWLALSNRLLYFMVQNYTMHVGVPRNRDRFMRQLRGNAVDDVEHKARLLVLPSDRDQPTG